MRGWERGASRLAVILFVGGVAILAVVVIAPIFSACGCDGHGAKDLEQVRNMGNGMTLYWKKYGSFPCFVDMRAPSTDSIGKARKNEGRPACLALKLLMSAGIVEETRIFFSSLRSAPEPTAATVAAMTKVLDPRKDPTWFCTYAYDPGHNPDQGDVPFFGDVAEFARQSEHRETNVLTCEMVAKELDLNDQQAYVFSNHALNDLAQSPDDIHRDDSGKFGWRDSYLVWDVPANQP